ncbi:conserved hypothetical protein [Gammaproteobacteria bacterium]
MPKLSTIDHRRDSAGLTYVYPVVSRRSRGLSIGINLNPNNACNWRCIYCQVPDLTRGAAPDINLTQLADELRRLLEEIDSGDFYERFSLPEGQRIIRDLAISGNGEPTTCREFDAVIDVIDQVCTRFDALRSVKRVLISNGSLMARPDIQRGLVHWSKLAGEVWFKIDSATEEGIRRINNINLSSAAVLRHLEICAHLCPTWIQTCFFAFDGQPPTATEQRAYLHLLAEVQQRKIPIGGVLLYGLARPAMQAESPRLSAVSGAWLENIGQKINGLGLQVQVNE